MNEPVPAAQKVLARAGMTADDIDLFEVNDAVAVVSAQFIRDLAVCPGLIHRVLGDNRDVKQYVLDQGRVGRVALLIFVQNSVVPKQIMAR